MTATDPLAARYFTSREIYDLESTRIFQRQWLCVGRAADTAAPGDYRLVELEGESLILLCDQDRQLRGFYNMCRHRGARLCESAEGKLGRAICCPYHGWTYDLQGRLIDAPGMAGAASFDAAAFPLKEVAAEVWEGFVFVNFHTEPFPFAAAWAPLAGKFRDWRLDELAVVRRIEYVVQANWKLVFQNYNECYHCPRVHPALNLLTPARSATNDLSSGPFLGGPMELTAGAATMSLGGRSCGDVFPNLNPADRRRVYYYSLFPTMLLSPHPDYVLVHRVQRLDISATRVTCELLFHPDSIRKPTFDPAPAITFWDQVNRQDWRVCELTQQGVTSRSYAPAPYSPRETMVAAFDQHYLHHLNTQDMATS